MALVFISHSSDDNTQVEIIFKSIQDSGLDYLFLDYDSDDGIKAGEEWERRLFHEIKRSHAFIALISPSWIESKWCFAEYQQAKALGKEIIPIIIDSGVDGEVTQWITSHIQQSDFTKDRDVLKRVIKRIKEIAIDTQKGFRWDKNRLPYPGLISFEEEDAAIFFGREDETISIIEKLNAMQNRNSPKFLNIVAASGLGKSSLLKAGVLPRLKLVYKNRWIVLPTFRPMQRPLYELSKLFAKFLSKEQEYKEIYKNLQSKNYQKYLDDIITDIEFLTERNISILFSIDQTEEFYSVSQEDEKNFCFRVIEYLLVNKNFYMVWTLRADYLKEFQTDKLTKNIHKYEQLFSLDSLSKENISSIIKKPLDIVGVSIDAILIEKLKNDMQTTDALPLLALTLYELYIKFSQFGRLTLSDYKKLAQDKENPLENIVQRKADEAILDFKDDKKSMTALKNAFIPHLVRINEKRDGYVKKRAIVDDISLDAYEVIEELVKARLLIKTNIEDMNKLEISHEALIRTWSLLQRWLKEEEEFLISKSQLELYLQEWQKTDIKNKNRALLSGIRLEKVTQWKDKLTNQEEIEYINQSIKHEYSLSKKRRNFLIGSFSVISSFGIFSAFEWYRADKSEKMANDKSLLLKQEIVKARHNIGLFFAEKAKIYVKEKRLAKAHLYGYYGLTYLDYKLDKTDVVSTIVGILESYPYIKTTFIGTKHISGVQRVLISKDNKAVISTSDDRTIMFWNLSTGKVEKVLKGHTGKVNNVTFTKNTKTMFSSSSDSTIIVWDFITYKIKKILKGHNDRVYTLVLTADEKYLISCSWDKTIRIWDLKTYKTKKVLRGHKDCIEDIALSSDGKKLYSASYDHTIGIWNLEKYKNIGFLKGHTDRVNRIKLKDNNILISSSSDRTIRFWNLEENDTTSVLKGHTDRVYDIQLFHKEDKLISTSKDRTICLWDLTNGEQEMLLDAHTDSCFGIDISLDDSILVSASWDDTVRFWDLSMLNKKKIFLGHSKDIYIIKLLNDGKSFLTGGVDRTIRLWNTKSNEVLKVFKGHRESIYDISIYNNEKFFLSASEDKSIRIWDIKSGRCVNVIKGHSLRVYKVALSNDNSFIASASEDKSIRILDLKNYEIKYIFKHLRAVYHVSISSDDKKVASASYDKTVKLWSLENGKLLKTFNGHTDRVYFVMFDKYDRYLYSAGKDQTIRKWNIKTGECLKIYKGHTNRIYWLKITPDQNTLASSSRDNTVRLWDINTGDIKHVLKGHTKRIYSFDITPDGKTLISSSWDKTIKYWDIETGKLLKTLKEYKDAKILSYDEKIIELSDKTILDIPTIKKEIKSLEKQYQSKLDGIDLVPYEEPYDHPEWSKSHPLYKKG